MFSSPPLLRLALVGFASGLTFSFFTRAVADLLTAVWSVTICLPNWRTSLLEPFFSATLPASMSTWLAVTTMWAICGSVGPCWAWAVTRTAPANSAARTEGMRMGVSWLPGHRRHQCAPRSRATDNSGRGLAVQPGVDPALQALHRFERVHAQHARL